MPVEINLQLAENMQLQLLSEGIQELNRDSIAAKFGPKVLVSKAGELCRAADDGMLITLTQDSMATLIRSHCIPGRLKKPKNSEVDEEEEAEAVFVEEPMIPRNLIRAYMESGHWTSIPRVKAVARAPVVRPDFSICWEEGWDETTGCWVTKGLEKDTTLVDAKFDIRRIFSSFPFVDRRLVADALAAALTPLLATAIESPLPSLIVSARKPGSGKTELAKFCSILGNGGKKFTTWKGAGELEKMIGTYVSEDSRVVIFDNIKNDIDSTAMESVITGRSVSYRKMYSHQSISLVSNTSWFMTANGAIVSPDMVRRSIVIMLDKENTPGLIEWKGTIPRTVEKMEAQLVTLMCHMIEEWRDAGCIDGSYSFSNFEEWSAIVSGILEHAGIGGIGEARNDVVAESIQTDDEDEIPIVEAIAWVMGADEWTAADLWETVNDVMAVLDPKTALVKRWLDSVAPKKGAGRMPTVPTGRALHHLVGKRYAGSSVLVDVRVGGGNKKFYKCVTVDGTALSVKPERAAESSF